MARRAFVFGSNGSPEYGQLKFAKADAEAVGRCLAGPGCDFQVADPQGTESPWSVARDLTAMLDACDRDDVFVCYFSGHGDLAAGELFLILDTSTPTAPGTALVAADVMKYIARCKARNKLLILDCCHAGAAVGAKRAREPEVTDLGILSKNHLTLLASGRLERAREFDHLGGSFLAHEMCRVLAASTGQSVSVKDLVDELRARAERHNHDEPTMEVPLPFLYGEMGGDLLLRGAASRDVRVRFTRVTQPEVGPLVEAIQPRLKWRPELLQARLPVVVEWPPEVAALLGKLGDMVAQNAWPREATVADRSGIKAVVERIAPSIALQIAEGVRRIASLAHRDFVPRAHLTPRELGRLLEVYLQSKLVALIRVLCSTLAVADGIPHEPWMEDFFALSASSRDDVILGLPYVAAVSRTASILFWSEAELVHGTISCRVFLPSNLLGADPVAVSRAQLLDYVLPQLVDIPALLDDVSALLQDPASALWIVNALRLVDVRTFGIAADLPSIASVLQEVGVPFEWGADWRAMAGTRFPAMKAALLRLREAPGEGGEAPDQLDAPTVPYNATDLAPAPVEDEEPPVPIAPRSYVLRFISGKYQGGEFALPPSGTLVIGRASNMDIVLVEDMVSRKHAQITIGNGQIWIEDVGSASGTFVNGQKIKRARLEVADRILVGASIIKLVEADTPRANDDAAQRGATAQAATRSRPALRFIGGKYSGGEFSLAPNRSIRVGRSSDLDMVLVDDAVSPEHAVITTDPDGAVWIEDLHSSNGTLVNGQRIARAKLNVGDQVTIGSSTLQLV